jgi:hypothetical protein
MATISSTMTDGPGGKLFPMEAGGPMQGICRVNEWADVHEYSVDGWAEVVVYKVGTWYHIHRWAQTDIKLDGWAEGIIKYCIRRVGPDTYYLDRWAESVFKNISLDGWAKGIVRDIVLDGWAKGGIKYRRVGPCLS